MFQLLISAKGLVGSANPGSVEVKLVMTELAAGTANNGRKNKDCVTRYDSFLR